jgi:hypothetical protein
VTEQPHLLLCLKTDEIDEVSATRSGVIHAIHKIKTHNITWTREKESDTTTSLSSKQI